MNRLFTACVCLMFASALVAQSPAIGTGKTQPTKKQSSPSATAESLVVCSALLQPEPLTPLGFAKAALVSLWYARNASERGNEIKQAAKDTDNMLSFQTALLRITKYGTNDFICAKRSVRPFTTKRSDENDNNRTAARFLLVVYDAHITINQRLINIVKRMGEIKQAEFSDQISTLQVERDQRWADLVTPTTLALASMIDMERTDDNGHANRLIITKEQRKDLLDWANSNFPEFTNGASKDKWSDPAKTAQMYFSFLNDRKCSDE